MAGRTIDVKLRVRGDGSEKRALNTMQQMNKEKDKLERPSRVLSQAAAESREYGVARSAVGTGAAGRDFAKQAQGLGGLVQLYATFAANAFAAQAAFTALSNAMDTTNMVRGMDQLGASTGVALGGLSKRLVQVTDGAISMRDAMEATTKATAAGMTQKQLLELGEGAKKVSQAMGVSMPDALSRLSRGITKLEPELLDELGLFTKIDPAVQEYARSIGKTANTLTDFERRQAFTVAVLKELKTKFGEVAVDVNPYSKLLSVLKDVTQAGLELINKVASPIASIFANNSSLIVASLLLIGTTLVSRVFPIFSEWRKRITETAQDAKAKAALIQESFGIKFVERTNQIFNVPQLKREADIAIKTRDDAIKQFLQQDNNYAKSAKSRSKIFQTLTSGGEIDDQMLARMQKEAAARTKDNTEASLKHAAALKKVQESIKAATIAQKELNRAQDEAQMVADKPTKFLSPDWQREQIYKKAAARSERLNILSTVSENVDTGGFKFAMGELNKQVKDSKALGFFDKFRTLVTGAFAAGTEVASVFLRAISNFNVYIMAATTAIAIFDAVFSKNEKQLQEYTDSIEVLNESTKTMIDTSNKLGKSMIDEKSIIARATAFENLADSIDTTIDKFNKQKDAASWWDSTKNWVKDLGIFSAGTASDLSSSLSKAIRSGIENAPGNAGQEFQQEVFGILGIDKLEDLDKALKNVAKREDSAAVLKKIGQAAEDSKAPIKDMSNSLVNFDNALKAASIAQKDLLNTFLPTDPLSKYGSALIQVGLSFQKAFDTAPAASMNMILKDISNIQLFPEETMRQLTAVRGEFTESAKTIKAVDLAIMDVDVRLQDLSKSIIAVGGTPENARATTMASLTSISGSKAQKEAGVPQGLATARTSIDRRDLEQRRADREVLNKFREDLVSLRRTEQQKIEETFNIIKNSGAELIARGLELVQQSLTNAQQQARIDIEKARVQGLGGFTEIGVTADLKQQELKLQESMIRVQTSLNDSVLRNAIATELLASINLKTDLDAKQKAGEKLTGAEQRAYKSASDVISDFTALAEYFGKSPESRSRMSLPKTKSIMVQDELGVETEKQVPLGAAGQAIVAQQAQIQIGQKTALTQIAGKKELVELERVKNIRSETFKRSQDELKLDIDRLKTQRQSLDTIVDGLPYQDESLLLRKQQLDQDIKSKELALTLNEAQNKINELNRYNTETKLKYNDLVLRDIGLQQGIQSSLETQFNIQKDQVEFENKKAIAANRYAKALYEAEQVSKGRQFTEKMSELEVSGAQELLSIRSSMGQITDKEQYQLTKSLAIQSLRNQVASSEAALAEKRQKAETEYANKLEVANAKTNMTERLTQLAIINTERANTLKDLEREDALLQKQNQTRKTVIDLQGSMTYEQQEFTKSFQNGFMSMGDAIADFAMTGKLNFKGLIDSMISDFIRMMLRIQMQKLAVSATSPEGWIGKIGAAMFGAATGSPTAGFTGDTGGSLFNIDQIPVKQAKGGAWNAGVQAFAKGGMFTNSIVNSPTLFKFAKGTGLMGEAGPEAIMPLTRDNSGRLGVTAQNSNASIDVVVNNYTGQQATTRESKDARGNRKIEVVVGDMAATEMSRPGSMTQQSMKNNFGIQPILTRR